MGEDPKEGASQSRKGSSGGPVGWARGKAACLGQEKEGGQVINRLAALWLESKSNTVFLVGLVVLLAGCMALPFALIASIPQSWKDRLSEPAPLWSVLVLGYVFFLFARKKG
jgi:hypothetical protein